MSGRIRTVKPELLEDAITAGLSDMSFRLFIACILLADDYGNLRFEPEWIRGQVYWSRKVDSTQFSAAIAELSVVVTAYEVKGQFYGAIKNWSKHQKVSHPGKPRVPGLAEALPRVSGDPRESLVPDLRSPTTTTTTTTSTRSGAPVPESAVVSKRVRGTRLPDGWMPTSETQAWARENGVADPCGKVLAEFHDFWAGVPGARGVKLDWEATFRNRVRQVAERPIPRSRPGAVVQSGDNRAWKIPEEMP